jgi:prepilin peptidase CpaA
MPRLDALHLVLALSLTGLLAWAAVSDVRSRRIPNVAVLAIVGLFGLWVLAGKGAGLGSAVGAAAIAFAIGYVLYLFKVMGAGDVKLFAAVALFTGMGYLLLFALATSLAGGGVAVGSVVARPRRGAVMLALRGKGDFGRGVPYGVAIAIGGALVIWGGLGGWLPANILTARR